MKKFLSSLLVVVIVLTALTSCADTTISPSETTLSTDSNDIIQTTDPNEKVTSAKGTEEVPGPGEKEEDFIDLSGIDKSKLEYYDVYAEQAWTYIFNVSSDRLYGEAHTEEKFENPIKSTIKIGKYETEAYWTELWTYKNSAKRSHYISGTIEYSIYEAEDYSTCSVYTYANDPPLSRFGYSEITVETLEKHAHNYLSNYIDLDDIKGFKREVYTDVDIVYTNNEAAHTSGLANGLLSANDELPPPFEDNQKIEKIRGYEIKYYIEFDNGFRTPDYITVLYRANGDISTVRFRHDDMDEKSISFDRTSVDYCVQQWIERVKKDNVELIGWRYRYSAPKFQCEDERICAEVIICVKRGEGDPFYDTIKLYISLRKYDEYGN